MSVPLEPTTSTWSTSSASSSGSPMGYVPGQAWRLSSEWRTGDAFESPCEAFAGLAGCPQVNRFTFSQRFTPAHPIECITFDCEGTSEYLIAVPRKCKSKEYPDRNEIICTGFTFLTGRFGDFYGSVLLRIRRASMGAEETRGEWDLVPGSAKGGMELVKAITGGYECGEGYASAWLDVEF